MTRLNDSKTLFNILNSYLGTTQLNLLGQYQLISGTTVVSTVPAIKIDYPTTNEKFIRKVVPNSGIECVITSEPQNYHRYKSFGNSVVYRYWEIILTQHKLNEGVTDCVEQLLQLRTLYIPETPIIRSARQTKEGVELARAVIYVCQPFYLQAHF